MRYAKIEDGVVTNIVEANGGVAALMGLVIVADLPIAIGDTYDAVKLEFTHSAASTKEGTPLTTTEYYKKPPDNYEELTLLYEKRVQELIHARYSYDEENKILRESVLGNADAEFITYNQYVLECKAQARQEVFVDGIERTEATCQTT